MRATIRPAKQSRRCVANISIVPDGSCHIFSSLFFFCRLPILGRLNVIAKITNGQQQDNRENAASSNAQTTRVEGTTSPTLGSEATRSSVNKSSSKNSNAALSNILHQLHSIISMQKTFHDAMDISKVESDRDASIEIIQPPNSAPR